MTLCTVINISVAFFMASRYSRCHYDFSYVVQAALVADASRHPQLRGDLFSRHYVIVHRVTPTP